MQCMFMLERLVSIVAPHECIVCGSEGDLACAWCEPDFCPPVPSRCFMCRKATVNNAVCKQCRSKSPLRHVWVRTELSGNAQRLLHVFKFERAQSAAANISRLMNEAVPYSEHVVLVPVPTATTRLRQRGYDHTKLLAQELSRELTLPMSNVLSRLGQSRQVGMKREVRLQQLKGTFRVKDPKIIKGKAVWLVDDVVTTGATLKEAARMLKKSEAKSVDGVVFAQK